MLIRCSLFAGVSPGECVADVRNGAAKDQMIEEALCVIKGYVAMPDLAFGIVQKDAGV